MTMITQGPLSCPGRHPFADAQRSAHPLPDMRPTRQDRESTIGAFAGKAFFDYKYVVSGPHKLYRTKGPRLHRRWATFLA